MHSHLSHLTVFSQNLPALPEGTAGQVMTLNLQTLSGNRQALVDVFGTSDGRGHYRLGRAVVTANGKHVATIQRGLDWDGKLWPLYALALAHLGFRVALSGVRGGRTVPVSIDLLGCREEGAKSLQLDDLEPLTFPVRQFAPELQGLEGKLPQAYEAEAVLSAPEMCMWLQLCFTMHLAPLQVDTVPGYAGEGSQAELPFGFSASASTNSPSTIAG